MRSDEAESYHWNEQLDEIDESDEMQTEQADELVDEGELVEDELDEVVWLFVQLIVQATQF